MCANLNKLIIIFDYPFHNRYNLYENFETIHLWRLHTHAHTHSHYLLIGLDIPIELSKRENFLKTIILYYTD